MEDKHVNFDLLTVKKLLRDRECVEKKLDALPDYDGAPEIKELRTGRYIYIRKRIDGKLTSKYIGRYSDELYYRTVKEIESIRMLKAELREIENQLKRLGYQPETVPDEIRRNFRFARDNMKENVYNLAVLDGTEITPEQTEDVIENRRIHGVFAQDVLKILSLEKAWKFITGIDIAPFNTDSDIFFNISELVNCDMFSNGATAAMSVTSKETYSWKSQPFVKKMKENIDGIISQGQDPVDTALKLFLCCSRARYPGIRKKLISLLFANRFLICSGAGLLTVPADDVPEFSKLYTSFLISGDSTELERFMKEKCLKKP
jgi:hypothetical protein